MGIVGGNALKKLALSTVASVSAGQSAPRKNEFSDIGTPFVRAGSLAELLSGKNEADLEHVSKETAQKRRLKLYPNGAVLFAKSGMSATKDRIYVLYNPAYVVSHLAILIPNDNIYVDYLRLALKKFPPSVLIKDPAYPAISLDEIRRYKIPVPEKFNDQIRIAHLLGKVEGLIARRKQHLQKLDELLKSVFLEMFGDPVRNEKGWEKKRFSELLVDIESGKSPKCETRKATGTEWGVLKLGAVTSCIFNENENKALPQGVEPRKKDEVKAGDLLFSRKNTYELVAACAYVFNTRPRLLMPDLIFRFHFKDDAKINPIFIWKLFISDSQRRKIQSFAAGAAGSMPNISKAKLKQVILPIPPIALQNQFATIVEKVEMIKSQYQQSLTELENLYGALSQKAFKGELDLSRIPLTAEDTESKDAKGIETGNERGMAESVGLPAPTDLAALKFPQGRKAEMERWLESYLEQRTGEAFSADRFMQLAQQKMDELLEDEPPELSVADYDWIKERVFRLLENGQLTQTYNDAANRVQLTREGQKE